MPTLADSNQSAARGRSVADAREVVAWLKRTGTKKTRDGMARYGLPSAKAFGVPLGTLQAEAKRLGRDQTLSVALWDTGWYEARLLAAYVGEPERVTPAQMDGWCRDFDNWGVVDTVCFVLFDRTPHAWRKVEPWSRRRDEFARRAGFALLACLALHDKAARDERFLPMLALIERAATDDRNFVKKGVSWALRAIGQRNATLGVEVIRLSKRLTASDDATARWLGAEALRAIARKRQRSG